jgi:ribulose-phosphate 3-epimerase
MHLGQALRQLEKSPVQVVHFDIMDGLFVPALTGGPPFVKAAQTELVKDVHLLVQQPRTLIEDCVKAGADMITVHVESDDDALELLLLLTELEEQNPSPRGLIRGVALFPSTPLHVLRPLLDHCDMVTVLAIDPRTGQGVDLDATAERVEALRLLLSHARADCLVAVDGGVTADNITRVGQLGADLVVSGSALFRDGGPEVNGPTMAAALHPWKR